MKKLFTPDRTFTLLISLLILLLFLIPTGFLTDAYPNSTRAKALVIEVDNSAVRSPGGVIMIGAQSCKVRILNGQFKGKEFEATNHLIGKLEFDKIFAKSDKALVVIDNINSDAKHVNMVDHYRIHLELILFVAFVLLLIIFAGFTGAKAILSFVFTVLTIWKILIPALLKGWNPIVVSLLIVVILTIIIITLVAGFNRKSLVAILGSFSGSLLTCILAISFGKLFKIHGAILPYSESLLHAGYGNLNLTDIFIAGIFIASSGALMDIAMDISASVYELVSTNPNITRKAAMKSGFSIGRAVIGTQTTTLLLAYSGGYTTLLMVFMAQGTPIMNIMNLRYISAEILHTLVGSFGLVMVAPLTAVLASILFTAPSETMKLEPQSKYIP
jgi:uncharacterized membrane protein